VTRDSGPTEAAHRELRVRDLAGDVSQAQLAIGWRTPPTLHEETPRLEVAAAVLASGRASRLYRAVRERALAASIGAFDYTPTELGVFVIQADGPPATTAATARAVWSELHDLRTRGVTEDEVVRARRLLDARCTRQLETMEGQANHLAEWEALGDWQLGGEHLGRQLATTPRSLGDAVSRWLDAEACAVVAYRPVGAGPLAGNADGLRALLDAPPPVVPVGGAPVPRPIAPPSRQPRAELVAVEGGGGVRVYRTERGVPVLVRRTTGAPLVHVGIYVVGGASEEPAEVAGLTSMLVRTALKGTTQRDAARIATDAELLGGSIAPSVGAESFGWSLSVPACRAADAVALLGDVAQHPTIPDAALDTERAVATADLEIARDDMYRWPLRLLTQAAFAGHPYGVPASGDAGTLAAIDAVRVRAWHESRCLTGPVVIAVVGNVEPDEAARMAARCFDVVTPGEPSPIEAPRWPDALVSVGEPREKAQTALALAFPAPDRGDEARVTAHLLAGIASGLGGRFFEELRDRQSLAYTVSAFASERRRAGMFVSYIATSPDKEDVARRGLLAEFARFRDGPVTTHELDRAKAYAIGTHAIRQQSGASVLGDLLDAWMFGRSLTELTEHDAYVRAVTAEDVQRLAQRYFIEGRRVEAVVRGV
jgi:zinc protease